MFDEPSAPAADGRTYLNGPLFAVRDMIWSSYREAAAAEEQWKHSPDSPHRRDWTLRAEMLLRAAGAWERFMDKELACG